MKIYLRNRLGVAFVAGGLCIAGPAAYGQSPNSNPQSQSPNSPNSTPGSMQRANPNMEQMQQRQAEQHMDEGARKMAKSKDVAFAMEAAQGGAAEVKMGKLAAEKASDAEIKAFGQLMVDDHSKANEKLMEIAKEKNMTLPSEPSAKQQATYDKLSAMSGSEFDKAYVKTMMEDHKEDVKAFAKESTKGKDDKIKEFATETLPVLQGHLQKIKDIHSKMTGSPSTK